MKDLFSKLGEIAQTVTNGTLPGMPSGNASQNAGRPASQAQPSAGMGDFWGSLKDSVPGGVGGLLGAGALGGILGTLLSGKGVGKTVRSLGEGALVVGGTAAAAGLAWKIYQKWSQNSTNPQSSNPNVASTATSSVPAYGETTLPVSSSNDPAALLVLEAMVFSARADGHIDENERNAVHSAMEHLFPGTDVAANIEYMMNRPLDPESLARRVTSPEQARDLYRLSRMVIVADHSMERAYLDSLAGALHIGKAEQLSLDTEVEALQRG